LQRHHVLFRTVASILVILKHRLIFDDEKSNGFIAGDPYGLFANHGPAPRQDDYPAITSTPRWSNTRRALSISAKSQAPYLGTGIAYEGEAAALHPRDRDSILEIFWDLFRQGVITLRLNDNNPQWPWFRLSRFGQSEDAAAVQVSRHRFVHRDDHQRRSEPPTCGEDVSRRGRSCISFGLLPRNHGDAGCGGRGGMSSPS
jgi:hypothetical protein